MPDTQESDSNKSEAANKPKSLPVTILRRIAFFGCLAIVGLILISYFHPNMTERVKFGATAILSVLALIAIAFQLVIYSEQWNAMRDQRDAMQASTEQNKRAIRVAEKGVDIAEQTAIYAQRAYLSATVEAVYDGFLFYLRIEHSGNTPANEVTVSYSSGFSETDPDGLDADFTGHRHVGLIAPKGHHIHQAPYIEVVTPEDKGRYNAGEWKFYCWGRISHRDIFREGRRTWFSFYASPSLKRLTAYPCSKGNKAE